MNDTIGENGLIPSFLVFGNISSSPVISHDLPNQQERMRILAEAQMEINAIVAEKRMQTALNRYVPAAADKVFIPEEKVPIHREKDKNGLDLSMLSNFTTNHSLSRIGKSLKRGLLPWNK